MVAVWPGRRLPTTVANQSAAMRRCVACQAGHSCRLWRRSPPAMDAARCPSEVVECMELVASALEPAREELSDGRSPCPANVAPYRAAMAAACCACIACRLSVPPADTACRLLAKGELDKKPPLPGLEDAATGLKGPPSGMPAPKGTPEGSPPLLVRRAATEGISGEAARRMACSRSHSIGTDRRGGETARGGAGWNVAG